MKPGQAIGWLKRICGLSVLLAAAPALAAHHDCAAHAFDKVHTFKQEAPAIACDMAHRRLLVIGELHGTQQTPTFVADLVRAASSQRPVRLGIEYIPEMQPALRTFLRSKGTQADHDALFKIGYWSNRDGRTSVAMMHMIEALRRLRAEGRDVDIFTMKPGYPGEAAIAKAGGIETFVNRGIADAIRNEVHTSNPHALVIAYMGNAHSTANLFAPKGELTATAQLTDLHPNLLVLRSRGKSKLCNSTKACTELRRVIGPPMHGAYLKHLPPISGARTIQVAMPPYTDSPPVLKHRPPMPGK